VTLYLSNVIVYSVQLAALVAAAYAVTAALRLRGPRTSLWFWQIVMLIAIALPLAQPRATERDDLLFSLSTTANFISAAVNGASSAPVGIDLAEMAFLIVGAGVAFRLLWLATGLLRLRSIVANAQREPALSRVIDDLHLAPAAVAVVMIPDDVEGPATIGVRRPIILLPRSVLQMSAAVQRAILCHELTHVGRRDWLATLGEEIWCAVLWFHPAARMIASRLSLARETVVDEITIRLTRDRRAYAEALLAFSDPQPHVIGATPFIGRHTLSQRISLIAQEGSMSRFRAISSLLVAVAIAGGATVSAVSRLPMSAAATAQAKVYEPGDGISLPTVVKEVKPEYTKEAMSAKIQGSVWMSVVVGATGDVADVQITRSLDSEFGLDARATETAYQWKFRPGTRNGEPVAVRVTVEMTFKLK
jgi:TonB family protein